MSQPGTGQGPAEAASAGPKQATNQIVRKGWLGIGSGGVLKGSKEQWFVLTTESISWYKDDQEKEKRFMLPLQGLRFKEVKTKGFMQSKFSFSIYHEQSRNVFKDHRSLDLVAASQDMLDDWKASFLHAGVYPQNDEEAREEAQGVKEEDNKNSNIDPQLERQVETIRAHVISYLKIVNKTIKDRVPKIIMHTVVNNIRDFCKTELLAAIYSSGTDHKTLMEESAGEAERRENMLKMYHGIKDALQIISDINVNTTSSNAPPPVDDSWIKPSNSGYTPHNALPQSRQPPPQANRPNRQPQMPGRPALPPSVPRRPGGPSPAPGVPSRHGGGRGPPPLPSRPGGNNISNLNSLI